MSNSPFVVEEVVVVGPLAVVVSAAALVTVASVVISPSVTSPADLVASAVSGGSAAYCTTAESVGSMLEAPHFLGSERCSYSSETALF